MRIPSSSKFVALLVFAASCGSNENVVAVHFPFDGDAREVVDGRACTSKGAAVAFVAGVDGKAAHFDGSGTCLDVDGISELSFANALTLECFVKPDDWTNPYGAGSGVETIVALSDFFSLSISRGDDWILNAQLTTTAKKDSVRLSGGRIEPDAWHHIAVDHETKTGRSRLWLDGVVVDEQTIPGAIDVQSPKLPLRIGTWFERNQAFCGALDDVRIWRCVLPDEVLASRTPRP
ncbi:MAG: LamG domain-containing protein [Planctomycetes bacterium]|nr:LamG domain-containing protein [Planctomycetota bacterium]